MKTINPAKILNFDNMKPSEWRSLAESEDINLKDGQGNTPLLYACFTRDYDLVRSLIKAGADLEVKNSKGNTAIFMTYQKNIIELLIQAGANVNATNHYQSTPLHRAPSIDIVKILLEAGACTNAINKKGKNPLDSILENLYFDSSEQLDVKNLFLKHQAIQEKQTLSETLPIVCFKPKKKDSRL